MYVKWKISEFRQMQHLHESVRMHKIFLGQKQTHPWNKFVHLLQQLHVTRSNVIVSLRIGIYCMI